MSATLKISAHLCGDITSVFTYLSTTECSQYPSSGSDLKSGVQKGGNMWWGAQQVWCGAARYAGELRPKEIWELFQLSFLEVLPPNHLLGSSDQKEMALTPKYLCFENVNLRGPGWPGFGVLPFFFFFNFLLMPDAIKALVKEVWVLCEASTFRLGQAVCEMPSPPCTEASGRLQGHDFGLFQFCSTPLPRESRWGNHCYLSCWAVP